MSVLQAQPAPGNRNRVSKNLDEIDLKILAEIQADGRITNVELAKRVGISPPPCLRRVRTLEEEGYIQGYRGLLDPRKERREVVRRRDDGIGRVNRGPEAQADEQQRADQRATRSRSTRTAQLRASRRR